MGTATLGADPIPRNSRPAIRGARKSPKTIARKARELADATVTELRTVNYSEHGREAED